MSFRRKNHFILFSLFGAAGFSSSAMSVHFEPGVGTGIEYTDNAKLVDTDQVNDLIDIVYVGGHLFEEEGALTYDIGATADYITYLEDSFPDQRHFNVIAAANWQLVNQRINWFVSDTLRQDPIFALEKNTPNNTQNSNAFTTGVNLTYPVSARQSFGLTPSFSQYYYEVSAADNNQVALDANWTYNMFRLTSIGLSLSVRKIDYTETDRLTGLSIEGTTFKRAAIVFDGQRARFVFFANLGATNVERESGQETTEFSGEVYGRVNVSSRSEFEARASTGLTDTSRIGFNTIDDPITGNGDVQITVDVVRNTYYYLGYARADPAIRTHIAARYSKVEYSGSLLDSENHGIGMNLTHPITSLLDSGFYVDYNRNKLLDRDRLDERFVIGVNLGYNFSRKVRGRVDVRYRTKESTFAPDNYDEYSTFVSLTYGFGGVGRPSRNGEI